MDECSAPTSDGVMEDDGHEEIQVAGIVLLM